MGGSDGQVYAWATGPSPANSVTEQNGQFSSHPGRPSPVSPEEVCRSPSVQSQGALAGYVIMGGAPGGAVTITTRVPLPEWRGRQPLLVPAPGHGGPRPYTWNRVPAKGTRRPCRSGSLFKEQASSPVRQADSTYTIVVGACLQADHSHKTQATQQLTITVDPLSAMQAPASAFGHAS